MARTAARLRLNLTLPDNLQINKTSPEIVTSPATEKTLIPTFELNYSKFDEIMWNVNLRQLGNFIDVFLAQHVSGTCTHHQKH